MGKTTNVIIAAAAGFVAGVLLAPKSGEDTRKDIKNKAYEMKGRAGKEAERLRGVARDAGESLQHGVDAAADEAKAMAKSARSSAATVAREAATLTDEAKGRASRVAKTAKKTASAVKKDVR